MGEVAGDDCCTTTKPNGCKYGWFGHALWSMVLWFLWSCLCSNWILVENEDGRLRDGTDKEQESDGLFNIEGG